MSRPCESEADLEVLVVVWVDAEAGHKAVDHQVHISTLAPSAPGERLSGVKQESLGGRNKENGRTDPDSHQR